MSDSDGVRDKDSAAQKRDSEYVDDDSRTTGARNASSGAQGEVDDQGEGVSTQGGGAGAGATGSGR